MIVSRGELVEIGGGFRMPDVLARSGAALVEVGTTNRTRLADYERAITDKTARSCASTSRTSAWSGSPSRRAHAISCGSPSGAGSRSSTTSDPELSSSVGDEPTVAASIEAGAHVVSFSGDKLLGGPQAGIAVGRADLVERMRRHPLQRALRADKLTLAALEGTLALSTGRAPAASPYCACSRSPSRRCARGAERLAELTGGAVEETVARPGGGALPVAELGSYACALAAGARRAAPPGDPAVVGIVARAVAARLPNALGREIEEVGGGLARCR